MSRETSRYIPRLFLAWDFAKEMKENIAKIGARKGIPKNSSSQILDEVRLNLLVPFLTTTLHFVNRRAVQKILGKSSDDSLLLADFGEHPGDHNHHDFPKSTAIQMGGVLRYKWEAYCDTNGRSTDSIPFPQSVGHQTYCNTNWRRTAIQIRGVLRYFFEK